MTSDLTSFIAQQPLADSHEHLHREGTYLDQCSDVLISLFTHYVRHDLVSAGADESVMQRLLAVEDPDIGGRFAAIEPYWQAMQHTGHGEAVRLAARQVYGLDRIDGAGLAEADKRHQALREPGERRRILAELGGLTHVQIDRARWRVLIDPHGPDFFLADLSVHELVRGQPQLAKLEAEYGAAISDAQALAAAIEIIFERYAPAAVAVKTAHAYARTLRWEAREPAETDRALDAWRAGKASMADRLCIGDWCLAHIARAAAAHDLPIKIHTGTFAGNGSLQLPWVHPEHLNELILAHPDTRFLLMHNGYPFDGEILALAKHFSNVAVDFCWAWSIDPLQSLQVLRRALHSVPSNKLMIFGGDTFWPALAVGYATQTRRWLARALQQEIDADDLDEAGAMALARQLMHDNQEAYFRLPALRQRIATLAQDPDRLLPDRPEQAVDLRC